MRKRILHMVLATSMASAAYGDLASTQATAVPGTEEASSTESEARITGEQENQDTTEAETGASGESHKTSIVMLTLTMSEDEFRDTQEIVQRYPGLVVHRTLPENFATDKEGCISVVTSLADDPEMKYILFNNGMKGIVPAFQTIREKWPDIVTMVTSDDDPGLLNDYADISIGTNWIRRGETIPIKAHDMGAKAFVHYSFPTHTAAENEVKRRDVMKETCEKLDMAWMGKTAPDSQTGNETVAILQFPREDIPRGIEQYGPDTNIFGTDCPMYDVILDGTFKKKLIVAEQCRPTPTQAYLAVLNLETTEEDLGDYSKINNLITEEAREAGMSGGLPEQATSSSVYIPQLQIELAKYMRSNNLSPEDVLDREFLNQFTSEHMPVIADLQVVSEELEHYYMLLLEGIYYQDVRRL